MHLSIKKLKSFDNDNKFLQFYNSNGILVQIKAHIVGTTEKSTIKDNKKQNIYYFQYLEK